MSIRLPAVAGSFYPADARALTAQLNTLLASTGPVALPAAPKALIVPHAGYIYSGPIAATAYAALGEAAEHIRRVVLIGPAHRVAFRGIAAPACSHFATPLGNVPIDTAGIQGLAALPGICIDDRPHAHEHALEVQLPFVQQLLPQANVLPLLVGDAGAAQVAAAIESVWGGEETLILASSDLSHYLPQSQARQCDQATVARILALRPDLTPHEACGAQPLNGLLTLARQRGLRAHLLDLRNSGDTAGDRDRVVGYAALALVPQQQVLH